jgi:DNA-binding MarR family transcriptional regulator
LTEPEVIVVETLVRAGTLTPAQIAKHTGLTDDVVKPILERLVQLDYVNRKGARYTAEARPRSP